MTNLRSSAVAFLCFAFCLLASGCGGGGMSTTPLPENAITAVTVAPNPAPAVIGTQVQFSVAVTGTGSYSSAVTWSVLATQGSALSPGTINTSGLYTTPYPAPTSVTVAATSTQDTTKSGSATVNLSAPAIAAGPSLTVDAGNQTHTISPYIYGMKLPA